MRVKYFIYQLQCRLKKTQDIDYVEYVFRTLFTREGVRA